MTAISVVVPAHNAAATIREQLVAIQAQLREQDELIVVDNRSTDATALVAGEMANEDARVQVVSASDRPGAAHARNAGARAAVRPLLAFCDADDVVSPGWLEALRNGLTEHDYVAGWLEVETLNPRSVIGIKGRPVRSMPIFLGLVPFAHGSNFGIRREVWDRAGGMDEDEGVIPGEDVELAVRLAAAGVSMGFRADAVVHYRYRTTPRDLYRQARAYSRVVPLMVKRMKAAGLGRPPVFLDPGKWLWLLVRLPWVRSPEGRARWAYQAGVRVGLVAGSFAHRELVL